MLFIPKTTKKLVNDLENAKYFVRKRGGNYGRDVDVRDVAYRWEGTLVGAGTIVTRKDDVRLLSYPSQRREEMEDWANINRVPIIKEETSFQAVEAYLRQSARNGAR